MRVADMFAGWGGFSAGAEQAGATVVYAANHWRLAVDAHAINHPSAVHECQDLRQADWSALPDYDVLLASPACQGHSSAARPQRSSSGRTRRHHDALRATAWAVVDCAEVTEPRAVIVENVPDFTSWALFPTWCAALEVLGYRVQVRTLTASVHANVPQRRNRLFVVAVRGRKRRGESQVLDLPETAEPAFAPHVQWDAPARWRSVASASAKVRERIAKGQANHGRRFITQHVTNHPGRSLSEPLPTITTQDQLAVVDGDRYRPLTIRETARGMGFADSFGWPRHATRRDTIRGLGNAVPPDLAEPVIERVGALL